MKDLHSLPDMAERALGGLHATDDMRQNILSRAIRTESVRSRRPIMVLAAGAAFLIVLFGINAFLHTSSPDVPMITSQPAGVQGVTSPSAFQQTGSTEVEIGVRRTSNSFSTIWEKENSDGTFPLVGINGEYYRLLTSAAGSCAALGNPVGPVEEFTTEPALSSQDLIVSNYLPAGTLLYHIPGMEGSTVASQTDSGIRFFQRVSFNGYGTRNSETLDSTLCCANHIVSMELSDIGIIYDRSACEKLYSILIHNSILTSSGSLTPQSNLIITLDNGLSLQLMCRGDRLSACGVWSCPEFFEEFGSLLNP